MTSSGASVVIEALREWLQGELGDGANIYHQQAETLSEAKTAHRFSISVPAAQIDSLMLLRKRSGLVRARGVCVTVIDIRPVGAIESHGRVARRDFIIGVRGDR